MGVVEAAWALVTWTNVLVLLLTLYVMQLLHMLFTTFFTNEAPVRWSFVPVLGTLIPFGINPINFIRSGREQFGDLFTAHILGMKLTFLTSPRLHSLFFNPPRGDKTLSAREVYRFVIPVFGRGIVYDAEPADKMFEQLQMVGSGLVKERFMTFVPIFQREASNFFRSKFGDKGGEFDMLETMSELTILTASRCLLGQEIRENLEANQFAHLYHKLESGLNPITFFLPWMPSPSARSRDQARKQICKIFTEVINKRRAEEEEHDDMLHILVNARYKRDGKPLSVDEICGMLLATLFAGQHTSSITSTWLLLFLTSHPECMKKVMEEQESIVQGRELDLDYESVADQMVYLRDCLTETLRMKPPLIMLFRRVNEPLRERALDANGKEREYVIPEGSTVVVSPAFSGRSDILYTEPDEFNPQRIADGEHQGIRDGQDLNIKNAFIAFGGGRHRCLGEHFAYLQIRTVISVLLNNYDLEYLGKEIPPTDYESMVAKPKGNCTFRVTPKRK